GGRNLCRVDGGAEQKAPAECPCRSLAVLILALPIFDVLKRAFTLKRQHVVLHRNVEVFLLHAREICHEHEFLLVLQQVHPWYPLGLPDAGRLWAPSEGFKEPVHLISERLGAFKGTPRLL